MEKTLFHVVMIDYPMQNKVLIRTFDNSKEAGNCVFGLNMNRTTSKCEYVIKQQKIEIKWEDLK